MDQFDAPVSAKCLMAMDFDEAKKCLREAKRSLNADRTSDAARMAVAALEALGWNVTLTRRE